MSRKKKPDPKEMPFLDHLEELRIRILICLGSVLFFTIISFFFSKLLLKLLIDLNNSVIDHLNSPIKDQGVFQSYTVSGEIIVQMEISLIVGIGLSIIVIFYQFWKFISPGLLPKERKFLLPGMISTLFCFSLGITFAYKILIPMLLTFFYSMSSVKINPNILEYFHFILQLFLVSGLIFELPVISFILTRVGLLKPDFLRKFRRYGIVIIFILAAVLTPPDVPSQLLMAFPLIILYEVSIIVSRIAFTMRKASEKNAES